MSGRPFGRRFSALPRSLDSVQRALRTVGQLSSPKGNPKQRHSHKPTRTPHELEETITDPGAEDIVGSGTSATKLGGWYDTIDANENGDKCAWVGEPLIGGLPGAPKVIPIPGAMGNIEGNAGTTFAVQSLWSNEAAAGTGYCAGAGTDLP
jgi:hypothetical protein